MFRLVLLSVLVAIAAGAAPKVRPLVPMLDGRIVGGKPTTIENRPYQVSLQRYGSHSCGGSIISKRHVVTAAHCTDGASASSLTVRVGSSIRGSGGQVIRVDSIEQHPQYSGWTIDYDASVLVLADDIEFGNGAQAIHLHEIGAETPVGEECVVSGWGTLSSGGSLPSQLQEVSVPKTSDSYCQDAYPGSITARMTCHGFPEGGKDSCQGDSGGPLNCNGKLVGIVSWGAGCAARGKPGVYAKVSNKGIHDHITDHSKF